MKSDWPVSNVRRGLAGLFIMLISALPASADDFFGAELSLRERHDSEASVEQIEGGLEAISALESYIRYQAFAEGRCEDYFEVETAAKNGEGQSQHLLSDLYRKGFCVQQDDERALHWTREAAMGGYEPAFFDFGVFLAQGIGIRKNPAAAIPWLEKATATRIEAYYVLAQIYLDGEGVVQNYRQAHDYALEGAELGDPISQTLTAVMKGENSFEFADYPASYKWALIAKARGGPKVAGVLASLVTELESKLSQQQIARIQSEASEWKPRKLARNASVDPTAIDLPELDTKSVMKLSRDEANARLQDLGLERDRFVFFKAIEEDNAGVVALYVRAGASVETVSPILYHSPLLFAAVMGSDHVARYLVSAGADIDRSVNNDNDTAILLSLSRGHRQLAEYLIEEGARLDHPGIMYSAVQFDDSDLLARLHSKGVPIDQEYVGTPLREAVSSVDENGKRRCYEKSAAYLIAEGARLDFQDSSGEGILQQAIGTENPLGCVRLLLENGASQAAPPGREPLFAAVMSGNAELAGLLLDYGADPAIRLELPADRVPLILAGDAKSTVMNGGSLLQLAVVEQHAAIARLLVRHGADAGRTDNLGRSALSMAESRGDSLMVSVLKGEM